MPLIRLASAADAESIATIYSAGIAERLATFETQPRLAADILPWIDQIDRYPLLVATGNDGEVLGWGALSRYRDRVCYAGVAEFSVYLAGHVRKRGLGRQLLEALIAAAAERGYWKLLSRVFEFNQASRRLCERCGFREVGVYQNHALLDGRWLDVVIVERLITANQRINDATLPSTGDI